MSTLPSLNTAWDVDRHIVLDSADKLVLLRFSSYTSAAAELEEHHRRAGHDAGGRRLISSSSSQATHKRARDGGGDSAATGTAPSSSFAPAEALLSAGADEHYLRTRQMDALLAELAPKVRKYCTMYLVDTRVVTAFNDMYELGHDRDPFAVLFFYRNRHIRVDVGTGNNNKINFFAFEDMYDFLPIVDAAYKAGRQGRSITGCDRNFSSVALRR
ncbi:spliceosomal U5 snRNP-specific protein [Novymonas esmeraldas]|uniref:Spliceosomal U5 snRNP-specific protein n=1 Tax=Novymonas esmeraldas TaxID=1808958 RepID=A0AAW0EJM4_9TRYP